MKKKQKTHTKKVVSYKQLTKMTWLDISSFWRFLGGILVIYAVINFVFVASFSLLPSSESLQEDIIGTLGTSAGRVVDSFTLVGVSLINVSAPSNTMLQLLLLAIVSMAMIWALRKLRGLQKITIRQAYYEGPNNIVVLVLVVMLLLLTLIPASIASTILLYALPIVGSLLEATFVYTIGALLMALSLYWLLVWWPALYIAMLPGTTPIGAMRAAAMLTKGRRFKIFSRQFAILVVLGSLFFVVVFPLAIVWQRLVPLSVYVSIITLYGIGHIALFNLYRSLIDEQPTATPKN
ncbi:MAG TPA: hypothetical protein PLJ04_00530 [Candidatus Saccharibacteria bacterium]|nr:hypothetical protein [Candidatus Nomurabacteria bacterium]HPR10046.1 hypothetical protein [Candidatus Saccharibacteria bacterium]